MQSNQFDTEGLTIYTDIEKNTVYKKELANLINLFNKEYQFNYIIPCEGKNPIIAHKDNKYTWDNVSNKDNHIVFKNEGNIGILVKDLFVIDIDTEDTIKKWEEMFPILKEVVSVETKKGKHYYFKRTTKCDKYKLYDKSRAIKIKEVKIPVDIKTICSTGTAGVIIAPPSNDKKWIVSPFEKKIEDIPNILVEYIHDNWCDKINNKDKNKKIDKQELIQNSIGIELNELKNINDNDSDIIQYVNILNPVRADNYEDWIRLGWCLYNISINTLHNYFELWENFSKKSSKFKENECMELWKKMEYKVNGLNIGTLKLWAKNDNPKKYEEYQKKELKYLLLLSLSKTDLDIANAFKFLYPDMFVSINREDGKGAEWLVFENHKWNYGGIGILRKKIMFEFIEEYNKLLSTTLEEIKNEEDEEIKERKNAIASSLNHTINCLKSSSKINNIEKILSTLYSVNTRKFLENLDKNPDLICFKNGVLEIKDNNGDNWVFRDGKPEDNISLCTDINFNPNINVEIRKDIVEFLDDICDSEEKKIYLLQSIAYCINGNKRREVMMIWIGKSRNGKGTYARLINKTFGQYYKQISADIITDNRNKAGQATSELADTKGKRIVMLSEPKENQNLQLSTVKSWVGNDPICARKLFKDGITFQPHFQLIYQTNNEPPLSNYEPEFIDKLEMCEYPFRFLRDPTLPHHKKIKPDLKEKFDKEEYAQQFFLLLKDFCKGYKYEIPQFIKERNQKFMDDNNEIFKWLRESFILTEKNGKEDRILKKELYDMAKKDGITMGRNQFYKEMEEKNGYICRKYQNQLYYYGLKPTYVNYFNNENESDSESF